ncbi:diacylglycerol/lipid kinase family protein [Phenylobacterium sp.]|jgi:diacylglycerol kinase family enzyme|uniref:diacylglycerol/lipid kinase family protein n=1 Tax=Phenylobacterium sp. TaxID=1871053 RepID=UPI002F3F076A
MTSPPPPTTTPRARPAIRRIQAVINPASGSVGPDAAEAVSEIVSRHGYDLTIAAPGLDEITGALQAAVAADPDLIVVLAGDGTARLAAALCGPDGPLVAPLAGGTLNMLPHAIYGKLPWRETLPAMLETGVERPVSGGRVGGHPFYVAAILGSPALWAQARESARAGHLREAWLRARYAIRRAFEGDLRYGLDGAAAARSTQAMALITPLISRAVQGEPGLEAAAFGVHSAAEIARLALNGLISDWRLDPGVTVQLCRRGSVGARQSIPVVLDGELQHLPKTVEFEFLPKAFRALAPPAALSANFGEPIAAESAA